MHNELLYVAAFHDAEIKIIDMEKAKVIDSIKSFGRIQDVHSNDGFVYFVTNNRPWHTS